MRKTARKFPNDWKLNSTLFNNVYVKEVSREIKYTPNLIKIQHFNICRIQPKEFSEGNF
jgi:hypothetical protein